jgi:hypothetical protein
VIDQDAEIERLKGEVGSVITGQAIQSLTPWPGYAVAARPLRAE